MPFSLLTDSVTLDIDRAIHYAQMWGMDGLELRCVGKQFQRVPNISEGPVLRKIAKSGLDVLAIHPALFECAPDDRASVLNDLAALPELLRFCHRIKCSRILTSPFIGATQDSLSDEALDTLVRATDVAAEAEVQLVILNDSQGPFKYLEDLQGLRTEKSSLSCGWIIGESVLAGVAPVSSLEKWKEPVRYVRISDTVVGDPHEPDHHVDLDELFRKAAGSDEEMVVSIVVESAPKPKMGLWLATKVIKSQRNASQG